MSRFIGRRIEVGPNVLHDATSQQSPVSRLSRARLGAGLLLASVFPDVAGMQAAVTEGDLARPTVRAMDVNSRDVTTVWSDGSYEVAKAHSAEVPQEAVDLIAANGFYEAVAASDASGLERPGANIAVEIVVPQQPLE